MYKKILIPIDMAHTEKAPEMIAAAKQLASEETRFVLANVVQSYPAVAEMSVPQAYFEMAEDEAKAELKQIADEHDIEVTINVRRGKPATEILEILEDEGIDLVTIGSHQPGLQDYLLGSTAARVVRHAQCPVLVMR